MSNFLTLILLYLEDSKENHKCCGSFRTLCLSGFFRSRICRSAPIFMLLEITQSGWAGQCLVLMPIFHLCLIRASPCIWCYLINSKFLWKRLLTIPVYPSYFSSLYAASNITDTHPGPLMENKGHGWGTNHHLSRLPHRLMCVYVNLFNFLPDLVEASITELALNVDCQDSLKKFTSGQAAGWLDLMTEFTEMYLQRRGPDPHSLSGGELLFSAKCFLGCVCCWLLVSALCFCDPLQNPLIRRPSKCLCLYICLSIWCPTLCGVT